MNVIKSIRSNVGFIITLVLLAIISFSPKVKALLMTGLVNTGLFNADVSNSVPGEAVSTEVTPALPVVSSVLFTSSEGITTDLANLKGKAIFLNFWTTWCPPCIAEMPSVNRIYNKLENNKNIVFILADADGNLEKSTAFMKKKKNFTLLPAPTAEQIVPRLDEKPNVFPKYSRKNMIPAIMTPENHHDQGCNKNSVIAN